jgi:hypothetical protein
LIDEVALHGTGCERPEGSRRYVRHPGHRDPPAPISIDQLIVVGIGVAKEVTDAKSAERTGS